MENLASTRPEPGDYADDYEKYISLVPQGDVVATLGQQLEATLALLRELPEEKGDFRYAEGKWSVKELVGHVCDSERVFGYRALCFARNDQTPLPGFDQDTFVNGARFGERQLSELIEELEYVRRANLFLFRQLNDEEWRRRGEANGQEVSVHALAYCMAGHELHHMQILRTRYL